VVRSSEIAKREIPLPEHMPLREEGRLRFIMDADANSVLWHWERYGKAHGIPHRTWEVWSTRDRWLDARVQFWEEARARLHAEAQKRLAAHNARFLEKMFAIADPLLERLMPVYDDDGKVVLDENGKPKFAIPFRSYEGAMAALGGFLDRIATRTGDVAKRIATVNETEEKQRSTLLDPVTQRRSLSPADYRALAVTMMRLREQNPGDDEDVLDALPEEEPEKKERT